jgi:hypothetical protein
MLTSPQLVFELAWTLLSQRKYQEAADAFVKMTEINTWYVKLVDVAHSSLIHDDAVGATQHTFSLLPVSYRILSLGRY